LSSYVSKKKKKKRKDSEALERINDALEALDAIPVETLPPHLETNQLLRAIAEAVLLLAVITVEGEDD